MSDAPELHVPVRPIHGGGGRGRGPSFVWGFVAVLVAVVGFALVGGRLADAGPAPSEAAVATGSPSPAPTRTARPSRRPPSPAPTPALPLLPDQTLAGAPTVVLATRSGEDLELLDWSAGASDFTWFARFPEAFAGLPPEAYAAVDLSPDRRWAAVLEAYDSGETVRGRVRVVGPGGPVWEGQETPYGPAAMWSHDSSTVAIAGGPVWTVLGIGPDGTVEAREIRVAPDPEPRPSPTPGFEPAGVAYPVPVAFSLDGRWLYGAGLNEARLRFEPALRIDLAAGDPTVEPIDAYPVGGPEAPASTGYPGDVIDPHSGRTVEIDYGTSPPRLLVTEPDGSLAFELDYGSRNPVGAAWMGDGRLLVAMAAPYDGGGETTSVQMWIVDPSGRLLGVAASSQVVNGGGVVASRPGFILLYFQAGNELLLALLRTSDGAISTVSLRQHELPNVVAIELTDPAGGP